MGCDMLGKLCWWLAQGDHHDDAAAHQRDDDPDMVQRRLGRDDLKLSGVAAELFRREAPPAHVGSDSENEFVT